MEDNTLSIDLELRFEQFRKALTASTKYFKLFKEVNKEFAIDLDLKPLSNTKLKQLANQITKEVKKGEKEKEQSLNYVNTLEEKYTKSQLRYKELANKELAKIESKLAKETRTEYQAGYQEQIALIKARTVTSKTELERMKSDLNAVTADTTNKYKTASEAKKKTDKDAAEAKKKTDKDTADAKKKADKDTADAQKKVDKDVADAKKKLDKDVADAEKENTRLKRDIARETSRIEQRLAGERREEYRKSYQEQLDMMKKGTIDSREELNKRKVDAAKMSADAGARQQAMSRGMMGVVSDETGTSFAHKVLTTAEYTAAGALLYGVSSAFTEVGRAVIETDSAITKFQAVLGLTESQSKSLEDSVLNLGIRYGGSTKELNDATLALGRAGMSGEKLASSLKIVSQMAAVSGSSLDDVTEMLVTWNTVYAEESMESLGNKITAAANASLASVDGFKTMTSYVLSAGQNIGMTSTSLISFLASMKQIGKADSIAGTETRRLMQQLSSGSEEVRKAYWNMGVDVNKVYEGLAQGGDVAEKTFRQFMNKMASVSDEKAKESTKGLKEVLDKQTVISTTQAGKVFTAQEKAVLNSKNSLEKAAEIAAMSYEKIWERVKTASVNGSMQFERAFKESFTGGKKNMGEINKDIEKFNKAFTSAMINVGEVVGTVAKLLVPVVNHLDTILLVLAGGAIAKGIYSIVTAVKVLNTTLALTNKTPWGLIISSSILAGASLYDYINDNVEGDNKTEALAKYNELNKDLVKTLKDQAKIQEKLNKAHITNKPIYQKQLDDKKKEAQAIRNDMVALRPKAGIVPKKKTKGKDGVVAAVAGGGVVPNVESVGPFVGDVSKSDLERAAQYRLDLANETSKNTLLQERYDSINKINEKTLQMSDNDKRDIDALKDKVAQSKNVYDNTVKEKGIAEYSLKVKKSNSDLLESQIALQQKYNDISEKGNKSDYEITKQSLALKEKMTALLFNDVEREQKLFDISKEKLDNERTNLASKKQTPEIIDAIKQLDADKEILVDSRAYKVAMAKEDRRMNMLNLEQDRESTLAFKEATYQKEYQLALNAGYNISEATKIALDKSKSTWDTYLDDISYSYKNMMNGLESISKNAFSGMEEAFVTYMKTGKWSSKQFVDSIVSDLMRMTIQMTITANLAKALGMGSKAIGDWWNSSSAPTDAEFAAADASFNYSHTGGISNGSTMERFASGYIAGGGYSSVDSKSNDVIPAMISKGEAVIPASVVDKNRGLIEALIGSRTQKFANGYVDSNGSAKPIGDVKVEVINQSGTQVQANDVKISQSEQNGMIISIIVDDIRRGGAVAQAIRS